MTYNLEEKETKEFELAAFPDNFDFFGLKVNIFNNIA